MHIVKSIPVVVTLLASVGVSAQTVQTTLNYPQGVSGVAVDLIANKAYVLLPNYFDVGVNGVQVLDKKNNVLATYSVPVANAIAVNLATGIIYVAGAVPSETNDSGVESEVVALNPKTGDVTATIPVTPTSGFGITAIAVDPLSCNIFVSDASDNAIAIINGRTNTLSKLVGLNGQQPAGLGVNYFSRQVYAALNDSSVAILNEKTSKVSYATYGSQTSEIAVDPFIGREFVTDAVYSDATTGVLDYKGGKVAAVAVGSDPQGVDMDFVTNNVYVANVADGTISQINAKSNTVTNTIPIAANTVTVNSRDQLVYAIGPAYVTVFSEK